ncbi:type II toxin-antitoxin system PemK/MazF family toxin [Leptolyngbyaceae cyanobacterium UHCC 1019]
MDQFSNANFPFTNEGSKRRPALVLLDTGDADVVVARVTSQSPQTEYDVPLEEWQNAGLVLPSTVRLHKIATLEKSFVERQLGCLTADDWQRVQKILQQIWTSIS